ncbi:hypothetical protein WA026_017586 [Henosepilachna vigintioctopunctata]|uniref:Cytochrome c oxidase polypeptide VIIc n=1 Tax=Henosepilachna vigintioctopunctata TaxID=420089 RepID=A0AAW1UU41_9CUCU
MIGAGRTLLQRAVLNNVRKYSDNKAIGAGLPWPVGNTPKLTITFILFFAPPFWAPFLITRYQMLKK